MWYVYSFNEAVYDSKWSGLIAPLVVKDAHPLMQDNGVPASPSIKLLMFSWPFNDL